MIGRDYLAKAVTLAWKKGLSTHLDGARIFNAAVKLGMPVDQLCAGFDTVSVCLSKGLGAPAGTVLVGHSGLVARARRIRKMLGGGMRQVGILAAAGLYALEHNVARLAEDHANAARLAQGLAAAGCEVEPLQTNMVFVKVPAGALRGAAGTPRGRGSLGDRLAAHAPGDPPGRGGSREGSRRPATKCSRRRPTWSSCRWTGRARRRCRRT